jgi:hypothetical protein
LTRAGLIWLALSATVVLVLVVYALLAQGSLT